MGDEIFVEAAEHREILPHGLHRAHDGAGMRGAVHGILDAHEPRETGGQPREQGPVHVAARAGREIVDEPLAPKAGVKRRKIRLKLAGRLPEIIMGQRHDRFVALRIGGIRQPCHILHARGGNVGDHGQGAHVPGRMKKAEALIEAQSREFPDAAHQQDAVGSGPGQTGEMPFQRAQIDLAVRAEGRDRRTPDARVLFPCFSHRSFLFPYPGSVVRRRVPVPGCSTDGEANPLRKRGTPRRAFPCSSGRPVPSRPNGRATSPSGGQPGPSPGPAFHTAPRTGPRRRNRSMAGRRPPPYANGPR